MAINNFDQFLRECHLGFDWYFYVSNLLIHPRTAQFHLESAFSRLSIWLTSYSVNLASSLPTLPLQLCYCHHLSPRDQMDFIRLHFEAMVCCCCLSCPVPHPDFNAQVASKLENQEFHHLISYWSLYFKPYFLWAVAAWPSLIVAELDLELHSSSIDQMMVQKSSSNR